MPRRPKGKKGGKNGKAARYRKLAKLLGELGRDFYRRGWALGTSGNFSAVLSREPLRLAITATGVDKGRLTAEQILQIDASAKVVVGEGFALPREPRGLAFQKLTRPSDEARIHLAVVRARQAGAVLHTHSVWSTIISDIYAGEGGVSIQGYEMLKGLVGVDTHEHQEWLPIIANSQDVMALAQSVEATLQQHPNSHGFLLERHGLYTWGGNLAEAKRHVEILEFLLEVVGRKAELGAGDLGK